jgi:hypothetical protein
MIRERDNGRGWRGGGGVGTARPGGDLRTQRKDESGDVGRGVGGLSPMEGRTSGRLLTVSWSSCIGRPICVYH